MKNRLLSIALLSVLAFLSECKSGDDPVPVCLLASYTDSFHGGEAVFTFTAAGQVKTETIIIETDDGLQSTTRTYVFNGGLIVARNGRRNYHEEWNYTDGRVTSIITTRGRFFDSTIIVPVSTKKYFYTGNKLTSYRIEYSNQYEAGFFTYAGDNLATDSIHYGYDDGFSETWKASYPTYDTKLNPKRALITAFGNQPFIPGDFAPDVRDLSVNNPLSAVEAGNSITSSYEYNGSGLPTREIRDYEDGGTYQLFFTYTCSN